MSEATNARADAASCGDHCPLAAAAEPTLDRRRFISQAALAAAALALAACGAADAMAPASINGTVNVNSYSSLSAVGGVALVTVNGSPLAIVRTSSSEFLALSRICPHQGATIDQQGTGFRCPRHGATFTATGTWTGGEHTSNMRSYPTTYDAASGTLTIG